ncbi:MAG: ATP-binding protein, partial [Myxococcota bacterium]
LAGVAEDDRALLDLVTRAATAGSASGPIGPDAGWRLILQSHDAGGPVTLLAAPRHLEHTLPMTRRAAAADVAAGVSHEVANALSAIVGWAQLGQQQQGADALATFALIEDRARTARAAARHMLDAVRSPTSSPHALDLSTLLADVVRLLGPEAHNRGITFDNRMPDATCVLGTPSGLFTIAWNLIRNAMEAMEQGGRITTGAEVHEETIRFVVADDGPGMDESQRLRAFDPYFTTKPMGTGLGLAMVNEAVETLGGRIVVDSVRDGGTRFIVELPRADAPASTDDDSSERRRSGVHGRGEGDVRLMLVEDDTTLREMMRTTLHLRQVDVDAVGSVAEALQLHGTYDVALVDLSLSDGRGDHLLAELRRRGNIRAAALVTGASEPSNLDPNGRPDLWLRKPFEPNELLEAVHLLGTFGGRNAAQTGDPAP